VGHTRCLCAISGYARHDYAILSEIIDWKSHQSVIDAGGSQGTLLFSLLATVPHLSGSLIDLPSVVQGATVPEKLANRCRVLSGVSTVLVAKKLQS